MLVDSVHKPKLPLIPDAVENPFHVIRSASGKRGNCDDSNKIRHQESTVLGHHIVPDCLIREDTSKVSVPRILSCPCMARGIILLEVQKGHRPCCHSLGFLFIPLISH